MTPHHLWAAPMVCAAVYFVGMLVRDVIDASDWFVLTARAALLVFAPPLGSV